MAEDAEVGVPGGKLRAQRDGHGEPLLYLHGAQGLLGWEPALAALAQDFDVIAPDHPGFGRTATIDGVDDLADMALLYLDVLDALDLAGVHVVGHCIGGWVAMEIAIRSTARIKSLTLVDSAGLRIEGIPRADMFILPQDELAKLLFGGDGAAWLQQWQASPEEQDVYERNRAAAAKFSWHPRLCNPKLSRWLHRIDVPTHVIWGEQDKVLSQAYGAALKERIPVATMTTLAGCGHMPNIERPAEFAAAVTQFIRRSVG
jgi:pimeloyl-ACP methyl ester carboxylesterase